MAHQLEVDSISLQFGNREILSDVYLKCETGKITGLLGRNGTGKSSLMNLIFGNLVPGNKSVRFDGQSIPKAYQHHELLSYLPQYNFIPAHLTLKRVFSDFSLDYAPFEKVFPEFILQQGSKMKQLSGGQRRLVETYILIKAKSEFVMLDEPFSHLSPLMIGSIKKLIRQEQPKKGFLITDHMYHDVLELADDLYVLSDEKVHLIKDINDLERLGYVRSRD
ncbi:ATP-binding cassette domain-containing protein [Pedobacter polysacchareus]|uniref:ATP-binding cassette domain-containing protein n=1 Tax=Pedobacter polysacchareus TaxID=2861973 RepID=UPI001C99C03E|nr:ATP-binding cassette domain-containing protein [Pedobacter polysacchareus]